MIGAIGALGRTFLRNELRDVATLEPPDKTQSDGFGTAVTGVPCRLIEAAGGRVAVPGGVAVVQEPRVYFLPDVTVATQYRVTVTNRANRVIYVDTVVAEPDAPLQYVTAGGTR